MLEKMLILAGLTEAITELAKSISDSFKNGLDFPKLLALLFGQVVAWGTSVDLLALVGIEGAGWLPYVGIILTGLAVSRGANFLHDLLDRVGFMGAGGGQSA